MEAIYEKIDPTGQAVYIVVNEIMYDPSNDADSEDWIELYNAGENEVDLSGWYIIDEDTTHDNFYIPTGTVLDTNEYLIISRDTAAFKSIYPNTDNLLIGNIEFGFGGNDEINLYTPEGKILDLVNYDNNNPWPEGADETGYSIELKNPKLDNNVGQNWEVSLPLGGTPFEKNSSYDSLTTVYNAEINSELISYELTPELKLNISSNSKINRLIVSDINGRIVKTKDITSLLRKTYLDLSDLNSGFYLIRVRTKEGSSTIKLLLDQ